MNVLSVAMAAQEARLSVLPARRDGSKVPISLPVPTGCEHAACIKARERARREGRPPRGWKHYTHERLTRDEVCRLFRNAEGICLVCGAVSGGLLLLETDTPEMADQLRSATRDAGWSDVMARLDAGYREVTPKGGTHWLMRLDGTVSGNTKLARRPKEPHEMADPGDTVQVLIETRGEGGQVVVAPSHGRTHPTGRPYLLEAGGIETIPTLTMGEWDGIASAAKRLDRLPSKQLNRQERTEAYEGDSIMDWFNAGSKWSEILEPKGWTEYRTVGENVHWCRPGEKNKTSATIDDEGNGAFYVFSTNTVFEDGQAYSKFAAWAVLNCAGDFRAAAKKLGAWRREQERDSA